MSNADERLKLSLLLDSPGAIELRRRIAIGLSVRLQSSSAIGLPISQQLRRSVASEKLSSLRFAGCFSRNTNRFVDDLTSVRRDMRLVSHEGEMLSELVATVSFCWSMISVSVCLDHINESLLLPAQIRRHYHNYQTNET